MRAPRRVRRLSYRRPRYRPRLRGARWEVTGFKARNRHQKHLQGILTSMLDYMDEVDRAGGDKELERWWGAFTAYRRILGSPKMESRLARTLLGRLLEVPWERFEEVERIVSEE